MFFFYVIDSDLNLYRKLHENYLISPYTAIIYNTL